MEKSLLQSKTFWTAIVTAVAGLAGTFGWADFTPDQQAAVVTFLLAVCGAFVQLRRVTGAPIKGTQAARRVLEELSAKEAAARDRAIRAVAVEAAAKAARDGGV